VGYGKHSQSVHLPYLPCALSSLCLDYCILAEEARSDEEAMSEVFYLLNFSLTGEGGRSQIQRRGHEREFLSNILLRCVAHSFVAGRRLPNLAGMAGMSGRSQIQRSGHEHGFLSAILLGCRTFIITLEKNCSHHSW
jgi:hypothetical protein